MNCGDEVHTPDHLTGEIHTHGKYSCFTDDGKRLETVAEGMEVAADLSDLTNLPEYSGAI